MVHLDKKNSNPKKKVKIAQSSFDVVTPWGGNLNLKKMKDKDNSESTYSKVQDSSSSRNNSLSSEKSKDTGKVIWKMHTINEVQKQKDEKEKRLYVPKVI